MSNKSKKTKSIKLRMKAKYCDSYCENKLDEKDQIPVNIFTIITIPIATFAIGLILGSFK